MRRKYEHVLTRCNHSARPFRRSLRHGMAALLLAACSLNAAGAQQLTGDLDEFFRSVTDGRLEIVREGLTRHPEWANAELFLGIRPVYRASVLGRQEVVELLLQSGADVHATTDRGTHALHAAAQQGHDGIAQLLLSAEAPVDVSNDNGQTPLLLAVRSNRLSTVQLLMAHGADLAWSDKSGRTALHYAAGLGRLEIVRLLVDNGVDPDPVDREGFTPLGLARTWKRNDFEAVDQLLTRRGASDLRPEKAWPTPAEPEEVSPAAPTSEGQVP